MYVQCMYYYFLLNTDDIKYTIKTHPDFKFMYVCMYSMYVCIYCANFSFFFSGAQYELSALWHGWVDGREPAVDGSLRGRAQPAGRGGPGRSPHGLSAAGACRWVRAVGGDSALRNADRRKVQCEVTSGTTYIHTYMLTIHSHRYA